MDRFFKMKSVQVIGDRTLSGGHSLQGCQVYLQLMARSLTLRPEEVPIMLIGGGFKRRFCRNSEFGVKNGNI